MLLSERGMSRLARKYRLVVLLFVLVGFLVFAPIIHLTGLGRTSLTIAFLVVIAGAINVARGRWSWIVIVTVIGVPTVFLWLVRLAFSHPLIEVGADLSGVCLLAFTTLVVLWRILVDDSSNFDTLCGAAAVYLLIGLAWASSYELIVELWPGAFDELSKDPVERWNQLVYFSLATLTTLGYGDISPINPLARLWSTLEAVTGVLYVAILVARLVAIYRQDGEAYRQGDKVDEG
jgi:hypothetical protein